MKWVVFLAVAGFAVMHVASNYKDAFQLAFVDLMYRVTRTTGTGAITSCCANPGLAQGAYASTSLPRTRFDVTYVGDFGARLSSSEGSIYLVWNCEALSSRYGRGTWSWANGGTRLVFANGERIGFPRQSLEGMSSGISTRCAMK